MTDESRDIAVLKQLVLVGRYLTNSGIKTSLEILSMVQLTPLKMHCSSTCLTKHFRLPNCVLLVVMVHQ